MSRYGRRFDEALDRHITGNYGEDQFKDYIDILEENRVYCGDCMELMQYIPDKSVDMILCDLPYGTTASEWDKLIPLDKLWNEYKRVIKDVGVIVLYGNNIFSIKLASANIEMFKYKYVWIKSNSTLFVHAKNRPLIKHEDILVFSKAPLGHESLLADKRMPYNPQGLEKVHEIRKNAKGKFKNVYGKRPSHVDKVEQTIGNYPIDVLFDFPEVQGTKKIHPNEKPIKLNRFLIKTYTQEGNLVLDNCCGTGSTLIACKQTNRRFIGIELIQEYVDITNKRLQQTQLNDDGGTNFTKSSADDFPYQESLISVKRESADSPNSPHDLSTNKEEANFS